jgi:WD40 repeat protein
MLATSALGSPGVCVYRWQDSSFKPVVQLTHFGDAGSTAVNINHNNQVIASAGESGDVILSVPENDRSPLFTFTAMTNREVRSVCFDPTSRYLGCGGDFEQVFIWDLKKKKKVFFKQKY